MKVKHLVLTILLTPIAALLILAWFGPVEAIEADKTAYIKFLDHIRTIGLAIVIWAIAWLLHFPLCKLHTKFIVPVFKSVKTNWDKKIV